MASGSFTGTTSNTYITPRISWSSTANTSINKSSLTVRFQLCKSTLSNASTYGTGSWKLTIGSNTYSFSDVITIPANGSYMTVYSKTVTITHDDDGGKSVAIKVTGGIPDTTYTSTDLSKTIKLDTIPRSSSFSMSSSVNTGTSFTVTINPSSKSFRHKVRFYLDSSHNYTSGFIAAGSTSFDYTIPHSWLPNSTSKQITVYLYTYPSSGDDYIARISKTITVNVPSNIKPTVSKVTTTISSGLDGKYVQGKSKVQLVATASPGSGANITSYIFKGANISGSATSYTGSSNTKTSSIIQSSGTLTYKVAVKDTRGRISDYKSVQITVQAYAAPQITSISAQRCLSDGTINSDGTYAKVTVKVSYSTVGGSNTRSVTLSSSADSFAKATTIISTSATSNTYSGVFGSGQFKIDTAYQIKATIKDKYTSHESSATLKVAQRTINIAKYGNGVAIGGLSTRTSKSSSGLFECNWDANFSNTVTASRGRFTAATDIEGSTQNNAPLRIGDAQASHLDFDTNEIISKDDPPAVRRIKEQMRKNREKVRKAKAKQAAQEGSDLKFSDLIGSITIDNCGLNMENVWNITYYAFHDQLRRMGWRDQFNINNQAALAGAKLKKNQLKHWMRSIASSDKS